MDNSKKKNMILVGVFVVLIAGAALAFFRDSIFAPRTGTTADEQTSATVSNNIGVTDNKPEPDAPNPPPRGSGKRPGGTH